MFWRAVSLDRRRHPMADPVEQRPGVSPSHIASTVTFDAVDARCPAAQAMMTAYFGELDELFPTGFDPGDALTAEVANFDPPSGAFVVVHDAGEPIGCGGLLSIDATTGEIKRMWITPDRRGLGLAKRLLAELERHSRAMGHRVVRLDTNAVLTSAIVMYGAAGYRHIERYNDNPYAHLWFEKQLT